MTEMTIGEWRERGYRMVWSIHKDESYAEFEARPYINDSTGSRDFQNIILDFTAPEGMPDGTYRAHVSYADRNGEAEGIVIRDGEFDPTPTEAAILEAACRTFGVNPDAVRSRQTGIDHVFIESLTWDQAKNHFEAGLGS